MKKTLIIFGASLGLAGLGFAEPGKKEGENMTPADDATDDETLVVESEGVEAPIEKDSVKKKKKPLADYDTDGDGKLDDEEKKAMREDRKKKMIAEFDLDQDGVLNKEEKAAMKTAMKDRKEKSGEKKVKEPKELKEPKSPKGPKGPKGGQDIDPATENE